MLCGDGVNFGCDWWALGVLTYESLVGVAPFSDPGGDEMQTYSRILVGKYYLPAEISASASAFLSALLQVDVAQRLGSSARAAQDIVGHAWFEAIDMDGLVNLVVQPPWRPVLSSAEDTRCFDIEAQRLSYDRLRAEGEAPLLYAPSTNHGTHLQFEAKWRQVLSCFDGNFAHTI